MTHTMILEILTKVRTCKGPFLVARITLIQDVAGPAVLELKKVRT